nr:MAG TPA: hypothetical protein [Caudoviricetes sp.]
MITVQNWPNKSVSQKKCAMVSQMYATISYFFGGERIKA